MTRPISIQPNLRTGSGTLTSGPADGFRSVEELVRFIEQMMKKIEETALEEMQGAPPERQESAV